MLVKKHGAGDVCSEQNPGQPKQQPKVKNHRGSGSGVGGRHRHRQEVKQNGAGGEGEKLLEAEGADEHRARTGAKRQWREKVAGGTLRKGNEDKG